MFLNSNAYDLERDFRLSIYFKISFSLLAGIGVVVAKYISKKSLVVVVLAVVNKNLVKS
jgi:hypothetical protein